MLKAGVIGLGVGEAHVIGFQQHPECTVVAAADFSEEKRVEVSARHADVRMCTDAEAILEDDEIQIVSIASYDCYHADQVVTALNRGKHVFVEKPMCVSEEELARIATALRENPSCRLSTNVILRRYPRFLEIKRLIHSGVLGEISAVEGDYLYGRLHKLTDGWRADMPAYSVVLGGAIHMVDVLMWLLEERIEEVAAYGNNVASRNSKFEFDDMVSAVTRFKSGVVGRISANFGCVRPHFHGAQVFGTEGTVEHARNGLLHYATRDPNVEPRLHSLPYPGVLKGNLALNFVETVLGRAELFVPEQEVFDALSVCLAIDQSSRTGDSVRVQYHELQRG